MPSRRGFVAAGLAWLIAACRREGPAPAFTTIVDVSSLASDGASLVAPAEGIDGARILVVRRTAREFLAFSMQCTHEGCPVNPPASGLINCQCHGSQYDLDGQVRRGPAVFPLGRYDTRYEARRGRLTVMA